MSALTAEALLAQISRWSRLGDGFRHGGSGAGAGTVILWAVAAALVALFAIVFVQYRKRNDMSVRCDDPEKLFRELCLAHQLTASYQRGLRQLAASRGFDHPAEVFLSPGAFDPDGVSASAGLTDGQMAELRARLF